MSDTVNAPTEHEGLQKNAISSVGVVFLVLAAASPLIGLTGAVPTAMVLGNGLGASVAYIGRSGSRCVGRPARPDVPANWGQSLLPGPAFCR